ncbi:ABC transporter substrate-binding protein [Cellulosimicrobium cellulans]|uniref:ABC transporter substrate-binding protein n=1 Tax=Cellulosimicrobium cellulans TaxID=1710 RepID=UPI00382CE676
MARRRLALWTSAVAIALVAAACSQSPESGGDDNGGLAQPITFWHAMSGKNGEALQAIVNDFNASQDDVAVEAVFQGKYNDVLTKLKASIQSGQSPTLVQVFEIGTQIMVDTEATIPFEELADQYGVALDDVDPSIAGYFTVDETLQALPFNTSVPLLYINRGALEEAGLGDERPETWGEVLALAEKLTVRDGSQTSRYGMVLPVEGWFVEQMLAAGGMDYCDGGNGRDTRATSVEWDNDVVRDIITGWAGGVADGSILNVGRNNTDAAAAFQAGRAAMIPFTSANLRDMIRESDFDVEVLDFVRPDGSSAGGVFNGGAALWTMADSDERELEAAAAFQEYLLSPDVQGRWAAETGYVPLNVASSETDALAAVTEEFPAFTVAGDQLAESTGTGCLLGTMPQARDAMNDAIEASVNGSADPATAVADAQSSMATIINSYNATVD